MTPKTRGAIAYGSTLLAGSATLGIVHAVFFIAVGPQVPAIVRYLIAGVLVGVAAPVVARQAQRMRSKLHPSGAADA